MRVLLFGASGMVGKGVLLEALDDAGVTEVVSVGRNPSGVKHAKLREVALRDFSDPSSIASELRNVDACFWCLGVSAVGMSEADYARVTFDYTLAVAKALASASPQAVFVYVSGAGTDSTEKGRAMWARVKGRTENALLALPFRAVYAFRPGMIQPMRGIKSRTGWYRAMYAVMSPFSGMLARKFPTGVSTTTRVGHAMLECARRPPEKRVVEAKDIYALSEAHLARGGASARVSA